MRAIGADYELLIQRHIKTKEMRIPMYSTLNGKHISHSDELGAKYWRESLESPVLFLSAVKNMIDDKGYADMFVIEIGPHSALSGPLRQIMKEMHVNFSYCPTLVREKDHIQSLLNTFGHAYLQGVPVDFNAVNGGGYVLNDLPSRPWQNEDIGWSESRLTQAWRFRHFPHHELLGSRTLESSDIEPSWRNVLYVKDNAWLWQHKILNEIVFPGAGYIAMVVEAIHQITGSSDCSLKHLHLKSALVLQPNSEAELFTNFRPLKLTDSVDSAWYEFTVSSYNGGRWTKHCAGQARPGPDKSQICRTTKPFTRSISSDSWYQKAKECGLDYGPRFCLLENITASPNDHAATAVITDDNDLQESKYAVHPVLIDQCLQLFAVAACHGLIYQLSDVAVPLFLDKVYVGPGAPSMSLSASMADPAVGEWKGNATLTAENRVVLCMEGATFFSVRDPRHAKGSQVPIVSHVEWRPSADLLPPSHLLPPNMEPRPLLQNAAKLAFLAVIEAFHRLRCCHSDEAHLVKYKNWVETEFTRIQEGAYSYIPESQEWTKIDTEARHEVYEEISASTMPHVSKLQVYKDAINKSWEIYGDLYAGNSTVFLDYMMEGDKLKDIYAFNVSHVNWKCFFSNIGHTNPQLRILEVGAGTCAATMEALRCLKSSNGTPLFSRYAVTDISPGFLHSAKATLVESGNIEYFVLDISQDPLRQGFERESFDLIIASNVCCIYCPSVYFSDTYVRWQVLHATPSLHETLQNVHRLLAPGGCLFLHELCSSKFVFHTGEHNTKFYSDSLCQSYHGKAV